MEISTLRLFLHVMRQRSFTEVARTHGLAPSSVSRTIGALEKELGIRLFQRSTRKLEPTEAGLVYFERISPVIDELEAARQLATDVSEEPRGTLRVTAPTVFAQLHIVPLLPEFAEKYPGVSLELQLTDAFQDLIQDRIDLAVRLGTLSDSSYIARRLNKMAFYICASPNYIEKHGRPEILEHIRNHNCLLFPRTGYNLNWLFKDDKDNTTEVPVSGKYLLTNSDAIKQCVLAGMGLSLLPDWLVNKEIENGELIRLFPDYAVTATDYESSVWLLYPSREYVPLKVRVFIEFLQKRILSGYDV